MGISDQWQSRCEDGRQEPKFEPARGRPHDGVLVHEDFSRSVRCRPMKDGGRLVRHCVRKGRVRMLDNVNEWAKGYEVKVGTDETCIVR